MENPAAEVEYAATDAFGLPVFMHEVIWVGAKGPIPNGMRVGHRNGDTLDNRRKNLFLTPCVLGEEYMGHRETTILAANAKN